MNAFKPDYAMHPGEYLAEVLESREIKKNDFARRAGISPKAVSQIINGKALYSSELALVFERVLDVDARLWMNLASNWQLFQAQRKEEKVLANEATRAWLKRFPVSDLRKMGIVPDTRKAQEVAAAILRFFNVSSPESCSDWIENRAVSFRKSAAFSESTEATAMWLQLAERSAVDLDIPPYNREAFRECLDLLRTCTLLKPQEVLDRIKEECAKVGVAIVCIPKLEGTRLSGASWWLGNDRPIIALSLRYHTNDHLWFTFFHEAAHILLHGKKAIFLDSREAGVSAEEKEADSFARNQLIPLVSWNRFVAKKTFFKNDILIFANEVKVHPAIVVGRLQHEKLIEQSWHNDFKESVCLSNV